MQDAPLHNDLAEGPDDGAGYWLDTEDGVKIRTGVWNKKGKRGTVLLFPGRTEFIEKYGRTAQQLTDFNYAVLSVDWRGQGLADRVADDPMMGHVGHFHDYQHDVAAVLAQAEQLKLPKPWYLLAHSMGGAIGLRAMINGLPVKAAAFTAPMWGIYVAPYLKPVEAILSGLVRLGFGKATYAPTTGPKSYVLSESFEQNNLTTDREAFDHMVKQTDAVKGFALGGPSWHWLANGQAEATALRAAPGPKIPTLTFLGELEAITDSKRIKQRTDSWNECTLEIIPGAKHEMLMERKDIQDHVIEQIHAHYQAV